MICIPLMLLPKPIIEIMQINKKAAEKKEYKRINNEEDETDEEDHGSGEIMVHQVIETIEFVLGSVSNTASYLRLWALSLAHSQLSKVFFDNCVKMGLENGGSIPILFIGYSVFAGVTFAVLLVMDVMECLLHTVRLHWVEF